MSGCGGNRQSFIRCQRFFYEEGACAFMTYFCYWLTREDVLIGVGWGKREYLLGSLKKFYHKIMVEICQYLQQLHQGWRRVISIYFNTSDWCQTKIMWGYKKAIYIYKTERERERERFWNISRLLFYILGEIFFSLYIFFHSVGLTDK